MKDKDSTKEQLIVELLALRQQFATQKKLDEDLKQAEKFLTKNLRGKTTGPDEFILNREDGTHVPVEISTYPVKIKGKMVVLGIARDITERKKTEIMPFVNSTQI